MGNKNDGKDGSLVVIPYCLGRMIAPEAAHAPNTVIVWGYILLWGVFELFAVPCIYFKRTLTELVLLYGLAVAVLLGCSVWFYGKYMKRDFQKWKSFFSRKRTHLITVAAVAVIALVIAQAVFVGVFVHIEADDAEYVVMANDAWERDDLLITNPYTGFRWERTLARRLFDPFPYWISAVAKVTHIAPATLDHVVIPVVFVLFGYTAVYEALKRFTKKLFPQKNESVVWVAMLFFAITALYGGGSTRTYGSMLLLRAWQGKAVFCGVVLPLLLAELLGIGESVKKMRRENGTALRLAMLCLAALLTTGMSLPMVPMVAGAFGLVYGCEWILRKPHRVD